MTTVKRLQSLDIFRGLTVALMIIVNNGVGSEQFHTLNHSKWNGLTVCDLVFPFFLFMVGVSAYLALRKCDFQPRLAVVRRIVFRSVVFFLIGVGLHAWEMLVDGKLDIFPDLRLWGVMQRIALCYLFVSLLLLFVKPKALTIVAGCILVVYSAILVFGNGYAQDDSNILCVVDRLIVSPAHLYRKSPIDPEGFVGTLSSFAHVALGAYIGYSICHKTELTQRMRRVGSLGVVMLVVGLIVAVWLPLNKRVWSSSYVLVTCGISTLVLILLTYVADHRGHWRWFDVFRVAGLHAFMLYVVSEMLSPVLGRLGINVAVHSAFCQWLSPQMASFVYSVIFSFIILMLAYVPKRAGLLNMALLLVGCDDGKLKTDYVPEDFHYDIQLKTTPVKSQGDSELCWVFSMLGVFESEHLMDGGDTLNLSTSYFGRRCLEERALEYYRSKGDKVLRLRGVGAMTLELVNRYGLLPDEAYAREGSFSYRAAIADVAKITDEAWKGGKTEKEFMAKVSEHLDKCIGVVPDTFTYDGKSYTPQTFASTVVDGKRYETLTCNKHLQWNRRLDPQLTDNVYGCKALNVKGDELVERVAQSLRRGNAVMWEGGPNDNHAVVVVGMGRDKKGRCYFVAKNSWGTNNPTHGLFYIEAKYMKKHTALVVMRR